MTSVRRVAAVLVALALSVPVACADKQDRISGVSGRAIKPVTSVSLPPSLLGLRVSREDVTKSLVEIERTYVQAVSVYGLRQGTLLQATLQVSAFVPESKFASERFRRSLVSGIGVSAPREMRLGDQFVFRTSGTKQQLYVWFKGRAFFVLAVRNDFPRPWTLLRRALEIPGA